MELGSRWEFHTHTFYSDGVLSVAELLRYGVVRGCAALALADHVDFSNVEHVVRCQGKMLREWDGRMRVIQGVELTHIPVGKIAKLASLAKKLGAEVVVVHGETEAEPVEPGTNAAAVSCRDVDILAHPGRITFDEAEEAAANGVFLELTARRGHNVTNGHVAKVALESKAKLLVDSDMHEPGDLITQERAYQICLEAGLDGEAALDVVCKNPLEFMERLG